MSKFPQIPGYRITMKLGQGGMADVYLGVQENLEREVAIKILVPHLFRDQNFSLRFIKEAQTAARLIHPNIITIHDVGKFEESYYIVMEYLAESLNKRIKEMGALEPKEALNIVKKIAVALDYAHKNGFIHRDIKPDNIMFRSDGTPVLVDFGIARAIDATTRLTRTGTSIGTPHYMSPEQCRGEKIDGRTDIYALGVQLFELITGKLPYKADNTAGIILKHIQEPIPRLPERLRQYQSLIDKMMAKDKMTRVQSGAEVKNFIDGLLTAQNENLTPTVPVTVPEVPTTEQVTFPTPLPSASVSAQLRRKRKKWPIVAGLFFLLAIATSVSIYLITQKSTKEMKSVVFPIENKVEKKTDDQEIKEVTPEEVKKIDTPETEKRNGDKTQVKDQKIADGPVLKDTEIKEKRVKKDETVKVEKKIPVKEDKKQEDKIIKKEKQIPKVSPKEEVKPHEVKTATLLDLPLELRRAYNMQLGRIQIILPKARFKVKGQIFFDVIIDEKGKINVQSFKVDMLKVTPLRLTKRVQNIIKGKINNIFLSPPKNKAGEPVQLQNWRLAYKVGKFLNKIILIKQ